MNSKAMEVNFDGLVGPSHNYGGLSFGNVASMSHRFAHSNPRQAALQGLEKMKFLASLGIRQAVLPPVERPDLETMRRLGFSGSDAHVIEKVWREAPDLLIACYSASSMWTANAATMSPSVDSQDGKVHLTPANLLSKFHRSLEWRCSGRILKSIFPDPNHFTHHEPLPCHEAFADEGAANHNRLATRHGSPGVHVFVYGKTFFAGEQELPHRFPARQTYEASRAISRLHQLNPENVMFVKQNPEAIDAGAFHNDVVAVGNENVYFHHERSYTNGEEFSRQLREKFFRCCGQDLILIQVKDSEVSLDTAVRTYLFNSQIVTLKEGRMAFICPEECRKDENVHSVLNKILHAGDNPIDQVHFFNLKQSMSNGGGPACLRLRVVLNEQELQKCNPSVFLDDALFEKLKAWICRHYRERMVSSDLADPLLLLEIRAALNELTQILNLQSVYSFQE